MRERAAQGPKQQPSKRKLKQLIRGAK